MRSCACIAFLRHCRRRLEVSDPWTSILRPVWKTYAVFSFAEVAGWFDALAQDPAPAGLERPYAWPKHREREKVVQLCLEILFKTVLPATPQAPAGSLLESCQEVFTCLHAPPAVDWKGMNESNAELLREVLHREKIDLHEFEDLCKHAVTGDLLPLARRLRHTVEDTVSFLVEARHLGLIRDLRLGRRWAHSPYERSWEVCLAPLLLRGQGIDVLTTAVLREHQRRRDEDYRDWELMLTQYVGARRDAPPTRQCLRRVLLAFLNTGEDVVDAGCGACSGCCPDGDFLPLAERAGRIIAIPPALWSGLEVVRKSVDALPAIETLRGICSFLGREDGARWRQAVYLNTQRMLREDRDSAGATALILCFIAHRWLERAENDLDQLFAGFWTKRASLGSELANLAAFTADAWPQSVTAAYWRARTAHAEDAVESLPMWEALLRLPAVPRSMVHEAASILCNGGIREYLLLMARTSADVEIAERVYGALEWVQLGSSAFARNEAIAVLDAVGTEAERAECFAGLLLAAFRHGVPGPDLLEILDRGWSRIETTVPEAALLRLLMRLTGLLATDRRWPTRLIPFLAGASAPLGAAILVHCVRVLERDGSFSEQDRDRIAAALRRIDPIQLHPTHAERLLLASADRIRPDNALSYGPIVARAGVATLEWWAQHDPLTCTMLLGCEACASQLTWTLLELIWNWAIEGQRTDVVRSTDGFASHLAGEGISAITGRTDDVPVAAGMGGKQKTTLRGWITCVRVALTSNGEALVSLSCRSVMCLVRERGNQRSAEVF